MKKTADNTNRNMDNADFVRRHFSERKPEPPAPRPRRKGSFTVIFASLAFALAAILLVYLMIMIPAPALIKALMGITALITSVGGVFIVRSIRNKSRKERDYDLIQEVLEGSRGARLITDSANNTVYFNKKFERLCRGVGSPSLKTLNRLFENSEESRAHFKALAEQAQRGTTDSIELFSKFEDVERWFMVTAQPVAGYPGYVHWRIDDVTQQHTIDRAIREEREKLIDFTDNAPVGFFSVDENGKFVFANATFARWVGEDIRTLLTKSTLHTYLIDPPENAAPFDLTDDKSLRQVVEIRMKGTAGKTFLASINQIIVKETDGRVRTRAVVRDLTAEREMRKALEASEDRFQRFFEEAPLGIIQVDENGMITDCNYAFAEMIKVSIDDIQHTEFEALISERDLEKVMHEIGRIGNGQEGDPLEITMEDKHGNPIIAQMYARKFKGSHSTVLHFIDITERKSLEAQFVQSQKMQAIGQLAGGVAHDFNNLLTAIIGYCDLLMMRHKPGDPSFADIKQVEQNAQRAAALVKQLLAFSRQQTLQPKVHDMSDILTEVSHLLRRLLGVSIDLDVIHGGELALVKVDERQMEQVLMNLAVNARDAMGGNGRLTIETENFSNKDVLELISEELPKGDWVRIRVVDTGCGISENNLNRIFEPFFTTKKVGEGTGLGLATVYGIVRQTGGFLDVESELDKGTTFTIYLPQASEAEQEEGQQSREIVDESTQDLTGSECILLVEDEDAVRTFSERALINKGYEVLSAANGDEAWAMFESGKLERIDLMISDVVMPGMDGPALAKKIREKMPDLRIIFMSGYTEDRLKDHQAPNTYFLPKPFKLNQLAAKVKEVMDK
jgi:two-component system cell cycle sensor histidine kinase/response regulator CckA